MPDLYKDEGGMKSFGVKPEDLDEPPSPNEIRARVINDARTWRVLQARLDEGKPDCTGLKFDRGAPVCAADNDEVQVVHFPADADDKPNRADETAYYCHKESVYYYHYVGGPQKRDVWMGPFKVTWNRPKSGKD